MNRASSMFDSQIEIDRLSNSKAARMEAAYWHATLSGIIWAALDVSTLEDDTEHDSANVSQFLSRKFALSRTSRPEGFSAIGRLRSRIRGKGGTSLRFTVLRYVTLVIHRLNEYLSQLGRCLRRFSTDRAIKRTACLEYVNLQRNELIREALAISSHLENLIANENGKQQMTRAERKGALKSSLARVHVLHLVADNTQHALLNDAVKPYILHPTSIRKVLDECTKSLEGFAVQNDVRIMPVLICGNLHNYPMVAMSRPELTLVFKNIYYNAIKYARGDQLNRRIMTRICPAGDGYMLVSIVNYGYGILPDECQMLFDERRRRAQPVDRRRNSSGIGLYQAKRIIEGHGGWITIESEKKGDLWLTAASIVLPHSNSEGDFSNGRNAKLQASLG